MLKEFREKRKERKKKKNTLGSGLAPNFLCWAPYFSAGYLAEVQAGHQKFLKLSIEFSTGP